MNILCVGKHGQLAQCLKFINKDIIFWSSQECDLAIMSKDVLREKLMQSLVGLVISVGAYTAVDLAESNITSALAINTFGVEQLGLACADLGISLIHISTDYVFNGQQSRAYKCDDPISPLNVYGMSKALGEMSLQRVSRLKGRIIRTSWLYSCFGHNFFKTMLDRMLRNVSLKVVEDQVGTPTSAHFLADGIMRLSQQSECWDDLKIIHFSHFGVASWYDFAMEIGYEAYKCGVLDVVPDIQPVSSNEFPSIALRPSYSRLGLSDDLSDVGCHWKYALVSTMVKYKELQS